ncbi:head GIN domain-containing protein [Rufibacter sp. XAAS-G3-1]|uniref:head GIN domain-containing protein n=1 Tax=Rufibacter sp. XAAS-G3-1 TaxID=2729134 RepID=UPI0015E71B86|nr:head GIN domain-containing protein [Rufibacter sp. XAAS-G3-1]
MKKLNIFSLLTVLALFASLSSFRAATNTAIVEEETRTVAPFKKIGLAYPANVILRKGDTQSVKVEGDAEQLDQLITEVEDGKLTIKRKNRQYSNDGSSNNKRVNIYITVPQVEGLSVSGSGKIRSEDTFKSNSLDLAVSGSGNIQLTANAENVTSRISGSGSIELKGQGKQTTVAVSGSGAMRGYDFTTSDAQVSISGSGSCEITATNRLKSSISGSGRVLYAGSPSVDSRVSGSGSVKKRG